MKSLWFVLLLTTVSLVQADADTVLSTTSFNEYFQVSISPQQQRMPIGDYHNWQLVLTDANGEVVNDARFKVSGGMVEHGHGLPSQPQVTRYLGGGRYLVEGLLFNMAGQWTLQFIIDTPMFSDRARFDFDVAF